ncbi:unnamed protein product [Ilex paraguariensis]|uniref:Uncharacterized protein n=1 Tax=Ilex paraguariensis TaxID=185542 RepID=A0ABC8TZI1_9AQUA
MEALKAPCSPENVEETLSCAKIRYKYEGSIDETKYKQDTQTSISCQKGCKGTK